MYTNSLKFYSVDLLYIVKYVTVKPLQVIWKFAVLHS